MPCRLALRVMEWTWRCVGGCVGATYVAVSQLCCTTSDMQAFPVQCTLGFDFVERFAMYMVLPAAVVLLCAAVVGAMYLLRRTALHKQRPLRDSVAPSPAAIAKAADTSATADGSAAAVSASVEFRTTARRLRSHHHRLWQKSIIVVLFLVCAGTSILLSCIASLQLENTFLLAGFWCRCTINSQEPSSPPSTL